MDPPQSREENKKAVSSRRNRKDTAMEVSFEDGKKQGKMNCDNDETMVGVALAELHAIIDEKEDRSKQMKFELEQTRQSIDLQQDILSNKRKFSEAMEEVFKKIKLMRQKVERKISLIDGFISQASMIIESANDQKAIGDITLAELHDIEESFKGLKQNRVDGYKECILYFGEVANRYIEPHVDSTSGGGLQLVNLDPNRSPNDIAQECLKKMAVAKSIYVSNPVLMEYNRVKSIAEEAENDWNKEMKTKEALERNIEEIASRKKMLEDEIHKEEEEMENKYQKAKEEEDAAKEELVQLNNAMFNDIIRSAEIREENDRMKEMLKELPSLIEEAGKINEEESIARQKLLKDTAISNNLDKDLQEMEDYYKKKQDELEAIKLEFKHREEETQRKIKESDELVLARLSVLDEKVLEFDKLNSILQEKENHLNETNKKIEAIKSAIQNRKNQKKNKAKLLRSLIQEYERLRT